MSLPNCFVPRPKSFLNVIDVPEGASGNFRVSIGTAPAGYVFNTAPLRSAFIGGQTNHSFSFPHKTKWHKLEEAGDDRWGVWMSTLPCEQMQMMHGVHRMKGHVLVGGLGLGLAINMLCAKGKVTQVTVIEKSADVIGLVEPHLRRNGKDVTVIHEDIFDHLKEITKAPVARYDSAFLDTWAGDGLATFYSTVIPLLYQCSAANINNVSCWQEDVMRGQVYLGVLAQLSMLKDKIGEPEPTDLWGYATCLAYARQVREQHSAEIAAKLISKEFGTPGFERDYGVTRRDMKTWIALAKKMQ
jgi:hypothetical protein